MERLLLSEEEAAERLGVSPRTLWTWRSEGRVPFLQIDRIIRYCPEALKRWIARKFQDENGYKLEETI